MANVVKCFGIKVSYRCPNTKNIHGVFVDPHELSMRQWEDDLDGYQTLQLDIICKHCGKPHTIGLITDYCDTIIE